MIPLSVVDLSLPGDCVRLAPELEALGYMRLWTTEHRSPRQSSAPITLAAVLASVTSTIRIGTAGVMLRYRSVLQIAEEASLLGHLFPDRFDLGLIGGRERDDETDLALLDGRDGCESAYGRRVAELAKLISSESRAGQRILDCQYPPKVWLCSTSASSAILAAKCGAGFVYGYTHARSPSPDAIRAYYDSFEVTHNKRPSAVVVCYGACAESHHEAKRLWNPKCDEAGTGPVASAAFLGTPEECREQLEQIASAYGVSELVVQCIASSFHVRLREYQLLREGCN